jgi:hypothetical protein
MNEHIKQLAEQAIVEKLSVTEFIEALKLEPHDFYGFRKSELEKFAELIVQECIDIIAPYSVRMSRPGEEYLHPIQEIKEHFGVEE